MNKNTLLAALLSSSILVTLPVASFAESTSADSEAQMCDSKGNDQECKHDHGGKGGEHKKGKQGAHDGAMRIDRMAKKLSLNDEQTAEIKTIMENSRDANNELRKKMIESRQALRDLDTASADYDSSVAAIADTLGELEKDKIISKAATKKQIESVLTDEQKAKLGGMKGKKGMKKD